MFLFTKFFNLMTLLRHVRSAFHLNDSQMKQLLLNSVQAAFLELQEKQALAQIINHEFAMQ